MDAAPPRKLVRSTQLIFDMTQQDKLDMLHTVQSILEESQSRISWGQLPNRHRVQSAIKFINTLVAIEKSVK